MIATKKGLMLMLIFAILWVVASVNSATNPATTWYLYNTPTPAGQILQSLNSDMTGWQPTQTITASPL
jgi:hypothetical protein